MADRKPVPSLETSDAKPLMKQMRDTARLLLFGVTEVSVDPISMNDFERPLL